ncbi:MurR/RpiR family transcriptional regulator [Variovorax sp. J22G21]|uniref:MurR/RpiR family transcriptional regulator n=1 Tax=Variovorax fucosicus TaxID=3053517 RepID=UPI0025787643|nr:MULTISPECIES: MurR/RpiR family transcriptional regulator [unclassified Variovorax]MDM0042622.1 MurR/RpiR family transcriptional regulator [Variovorax sp. J22R193]MDM0061227.1 MurR/RpiR family transcriptional regulator [Variovorax sp. J22G21]
MQAQERILAQFPALSPKLQAAARFVVDHPNDVVIASMRSLAERAGAQPATLVRLAQQLGYAGWPELKTAFAQDLGLHSQRYGQRAKSLAVRGQDAGLLGEMFSMLQQNLAATETQSARALHETSRSLKAARAVHIAGFRASLPIAYALFYGYRLFRDTVHMIDGQNGGIEIQLRPIDARDVVVVISFAPYSRDALMVIDAARSAGARVIALTDSSASPLALAADQTVLFAVDSPSFFPSVAAGVAVSEALLELLVAAGGNTVAEQIGRAEQRLFDSGAYLNASDKRTPRRPDAHPATAHKPRRSAS